MGILRFILAITVVLAHSSSIFGFSFVGGQIAVQAFYIISGFYMSLILNEKYVGVNDSYKLFISNRFLRLYPIYWIILFLTVLYSIIDINYFKEDASGVISSYMSYYSKMNFGSFLFLLGTNLVLFLQDTVMFLGLNTSTGNLFFTSNFQSTNPALYQFLFIPQAWTIGVEISFYLIAPFLVRKNLQIIAPLIIMSLLMRFFLYQYGLKADPWSFRFFPTELVFFLFGILSYKMYVKLKSVYISPLHLKIIFAAMLSFTLLFNFLPIPAKYPLYLFLFFVSLPFIFLLTKRWKNDIYIGELSYPIYISHIFVWRCINDFKIPLIGGKGLTLTVITVIFSILLNEFVAKKVEKIRQKRIITVLKNECAKT